MKIVIAGGSGLLGRALIPRLIAGGHELVVLTRMPNAPRMSGVRSTTWRPDGTIASWAQELDGADAVINLAGAGIADRRWNDARKEVLRSSRLLATRSLVAAIRGATTRPTIFLQGSAIGFYGSDLTDRRLDESYPPGDDALASLCVAWEAEAQPAAALGCRLIVVRSGIVLTREGGVLGSLMIPFRCFLGGAFASGKQYMSWIHRDDWVEILIWSLLNPAVTGVVNATAPEPVTNAEFCRSLGRAMRRPSWFRVPGFALRILLGEFADVTLIKGQRVLPARLHQLGFTFRFPKLDPATRDAIFRRGPIPGT